jgi:putative transposase
MKLTAQIRLLPTPEQAKLLKETLVRANEACDYISSVAWDKRTFGKFALQKLGYQTVKDMFGLTAQVVVRCIAKVWDSYKLDKKTKREFKPLGAISYDDRILK